MHRIEFLQPAGYATAFYPFSETRPAEALLWGGRTLGEQWEERLQELGAEGRWRVNPLWVPSAATQALAGRLDAGQGWAVEGAPLVERMDPDRTTEWTELPEGTDLLQHPTDLFLRCGEAVVEDAERAARAWGAQPRIWPDHVTLLGDAGQIQAAPTAQARACSLNTEAGPIVLGPGVDIQEGAHLRGPLIIGPGTVIKMGTRLSGPSAIGPECRIGGELSNVVLHGYSNKGHDGFLGNSVLGSWCNLGADTNSSNLKSNYSTVRLWSAERQDFVDSGLQFCGLLMGDHAKSGINTMFNTGTTVGTGAQIFGHGFPPKHIPAFSWGGADGLVPYELPRFLDTARAVMARRGVALTAKDEAQLAALHAAVHG